MIKSARYPKIMLSFLILKKIFKNLSYFPPQLQQFNDKNFVVLLKGFQIFLNLPKLTFTYPNSTIGTVEKCVEYVQS